MKKLLSIMLIGVVIFTTVGCGNEEAELAVEERLKSVEVKNAANEKNTAVLNYIGSVDAKDLVKYSFKSNGKIDKVHVEKGQAVKKGDPLVTLDKKEIGFQVTGSRATYETARLNAEKAKEAYDYDQNYLSKMTELKKEDVISQDQYDQLTLKTQVSSRSYSQAKQQSSAAKVDYDYKQYLMNNAVLKADTDGVVVEILAEASEQIGAYHPALVVRSEVQVVNFGIAQRDLDKIKIGMRAVIDINGKKAEGEITYISDAPDKATRTYNGEIKILNENYRLGSIAKIELLLGEEEGIWIPLNAILSNGEEYVYVINEQRAFKRIINVEKVNDGLAMVNGLEEGDQYVTSGMKNLNDGLKVSIKE